jgi:Transglutaminase-like superfamily
VSISGVIEYDPRSVPWRTRLLVRAVVPVARVLAHRPPAQLRRIMTVLARGARPADQNVAAAARHAVVAVSLACSGPQACLPRSVATALVCRIRGCWPAWCVGVRRHAPFGAHAWVEAEGTPVGETYPADYHTVVFSVQAHESSAGRQVGPRRSR